MDRNNKKTQPEFIDRIKKPEKYPYIKNPDGSISTHRMAAEVDEKGNWYVFPTIQMREDGKLVVFNDNRAAMEQALKSGNYLKMKDKDEALKYAQGIYKTEKLKKFSKERSLLEQQREQ